MYIAWFACGKVWIVKDVESAKLLDESPLVSGWTAEYQAGWWASKSPRMKQEWDGSDTGEDWRETRGQDEEGGM